MNQTNTSMFINFNKVAFLVIIVFIVTTQLCNGQTVNANIKSSIDNYFEPYLKYQDFSGMVLLASKDSILFHKGYGNANYGVGIENSIQSKYKIASVSKTFTAAAIVILEKGGKLSFDDNLSKYIPDFPNGEKITIEHLLMHQSGVGEPDGKTFLYKEFTIKEIVELIKNEPLSFEPGTKSKYSNAGYTLLAYIIETISGVDYEVYLNKSIFKPLDLTHSGHYAVRKIIPNLSSGYQPGPYLAGVESVPVYFSSNAIGNGSLYSSTLDLYKWAKAINQNKLFDFGNLTYPFGWGKRIYFNRRAIEQTGLTEGYSSNITTYPDDDLYIIVLANVANLGFNRWGKDLAAIYFGEDYSTFQPSEPISLKEKDVDKYEGIYVAGSSIASVKKIDNGIYLFLNDWPVGRYLTPVGKDLFRFRYEFANIEFIRDKAGSIQSFNWNFGNDEGTVFKKAKNHLVE